MFNLNPDEECTHVTFAELSDRDRHRVTTLAQLRQAFGVVQPSACANTSQRQEADGG